MAISSGISRMKLSAKILAVEAVVFFFPSVALLVFAVPETVLATLEGDGRASLSAASTLIFIALLAAGVYSLWTVARLVIASIKERPFNFGAGFWLGVVSGMAAVGYLWAVSGAVLAIVVAAPLIILCVQAAIILRKPKPLR